MNINSLLDVFHDQLRDIYSAETQLTEALPRLVAAASSPDLKEILQLHLEETVGHREQVSYVLNQMNIFPGGKKCMAMEGLIKEALELTATNGDADAIDAGLIGAVQKIEHYEIATYGTLRAWANTLGEYIYAEGLQSILDEEHTANESLTLLAQRHLNRDAVS